MLKVRTIFLGLLEEWLCIQFPSECVLSECAQIAWYCLIINLPRVPHIICECDFIPKSQTIMGQDGWEWCCAGNTDVKRRFCRFMLRIVCYLLHKNPFVQSFNNCSHVSLFISSPKTHVWQNGQNLPFWITITAQLWYSSKLSSSHQVFQVKGIKTDQQWARNGFSQPTDLTLLVHGRHCLTKDNVTRSTTETLNF